MLARNTSIVKTGPLQVSGEDRHEPEIDISCSIHQMPARFASFGQVPGSSADVRRGIEETLRTNHYPRDGQGWYSASAVCRGYPAEMRRLHVLGHPTARRRGNGTPIMHAKRDAFSPRGRPRAGRSGRPRLPDAADTVIFMHPSASRFTAVFQQWPSILLG